MGASRVLVIMAVLFAAGCQPDLEEAREAALEAHRRASASPNAQATADFAVRRTEYCAIFAEELERAPSWETFAERLRTDCAGPLRCPSFEGLCADALEAGDGLEHVDEGGHEHHQPVDEQHEEPAPHENTTTSAPVPPPHN